MDGILPLYKPKGFTSHDCVMKLRGMFRMKKIGHTGTLDPGVEGVLPICLGEATKIIPFLSDYKKVYIADVYLGKATTTEDTEGDVVAEKVVSTFPTNEAIDAVLASFQGEITQIPPMYSAVRVNGKRLYEYARENLPVERPQRHVTIHRIDRLPLPTGEEVKDRFRIKITCSKGTYIRTLCVDIGEKLGYPAHMSFLERVESDSIKVNETFTFEKIQEALNKETHMDLLLPVGNCLSHLPEAQVDEEMKKDILQGMKLPNNARYPDKKPFTIKHKDQLLAIYDIHPTKPTELKPVRVFNMHKEV